MASPPQGGIEVVKDALARLAKARPKPESLLAGSGTLAKRQLVDPQEVYQIDLSRMKASNPLDFARPVAWRYLVWEGDTPIEAAETTLGGADPISFSQVNRGPQVQGFVEAVRAAEVLAGEQPALDWELRYLRIPAIQIDALWLSAIQEKNRGDRLIPIHPVFPPLHANQPYDVVAFFQQLRQRVDLRLKASDETKG